MRKLSKRGAQDQEFHFRPSVIFFFTKLKSRVKSRVSSNTISALGLFLPGEETMLSITMTDKLNDQINLEFYSSNLYLQMSTWCSSKGYDGCADFLKDHSVEEKSHMDKLFNYVHETGGMPIIGTIAAPKSSWESIHEIFEATYEHEVKVTKSINKLVKLALTEEDFSTFQFLQWYVAEQHEIN